MRMLTQKDSWTLQKSSARPLTADKAASGLDHTALSVEDDRMLPDLVSYQKKPCWVGRETLTNWMQLYGESLRWLRLGNLYVRRG